MIDEYIKRSVCFGREKPAPGAVHVVFGIDKNYVRPMGVLMTSIWEHNQNIAIHVFSDSVEEEDILRIRVTAEKYGEVCTIHFVDGAPFQSLPTTRTWTKATYFRFIAGEYFYQRIERIIYLDADMLCVGSLRSVYEVDMREKHIAAVKDSGLPPGRLERISHIGDGYFNAGFLLIDTKKWHDGYVFSRAMELLRADPERYEALDQDVLNLIYSNKVLWLGKQYNQENNTEDRYPEDTVIIHYTATPKPWLSWYFCRGENLWAKAAALSEWRDIPVLSVPGTAREIRLLSRASFQRRELAKGIQWYLKYLGSKIQSS